MARKRVVPTGTGGERPPTRPCAGFAKPASYQRGSVANAGGADGFRVGFCPAERISRQTYRVPSSNSILMSSPELATGRRGADRWPMRSNLRKR